MLAELADLVAKLCKTQGSPGYWLDGKDADTLRIVMEAMNRNNN